MGFSIFAIDLLKMQKKTTTLNEFNQQVESYVDDTTYSVDCQPVTQELLQGTYGKDIDCEYVVYSDSRLPNGGECRIPDYDEKLYRISNELPWRGMLGAYYIYTLKEVE